MRLVPDAVTLPPRPVPTFLHAPIARPHTMPRLKPIKKPAPVAPPPLQELRPQRLSFVGGTLLGWGLALAGLEACADQFAGGSVAVGSGPLEHPASAAATDASQSARVSPGVP